MANLARANPSTTKVILEAPVHLLSDLEKQERGQLWCEVIPSSDLRVQMERGITLDTLQARLNATGKAWECVLKKMRHTTVMVVVMVVEVMDWRVLSSSWIETHHPDFMKYWHY